MRFTISREKLQEGLAAVTASIPAKTTLPVLANILVETTDKGIKLSGTDLDIAVSTEVMADVEASGAVTVPAKKLSEIARELPPAPVKIAAVGEQRVTLECGRSRFKLLGLPRDEFPTLVLSEKQKPLPYFVGLQHCATASKNRTGGSPLRRAVPRGQRN